MAKDGKITNLSTSLVAQLQPGGTKNTAISSLKGDAGSWFGPMQPLRPQAPSGVGGRRWDYAVGLNLQYIPRGTELVGFDDLRALSDNLPILRAIIETRKDQIAALPWMIRPIPDDSVSKRAQSKISAAQRSAILDIRSFLRSPDRMLPFDTWLRAILEEMLVTDAATIYPRPTLAGGVYSLDLVDGACYSDDTEVLTRGGWKRFSDVDIEVDEFATRNIHTKKFEWQRATYFHEADYVGPLHRFHSRAVDLLVSPNHRMLISGTPRPLGGSRHHGTGEAVVKASELASVRTTSYVRIPMTSEWVGVEIGEKVFRQPRGVRVAASEGAHVCVGCGERYDVPAYRAEKTKYCSRACQMESRSERRLSGDDYCALMGAYLAEGSTNTNGKDVYFTQAPDGKAFALYESMLRRIQGADPLYTGKNFVLCSRPLNSYLREFGHALEKFIPDEIMNATPRQIEIFWRHYRAGDGSAERDRIFTSSPRMADQLVELAQKLGKSASVQVRVKTADTRIGERVIRSENCAPSYVVSVRETPAMSFSHTSEPYAGKIRCVSVPNEFLYVRRNGKPAWCGNTIKPLIDDTGRRPEPPDPAYQQILKGNVAADFTSDELLYLPRNVRTSRVYGFSPVEQIILTINIALRRDTSTLEYYRSGTVPDSFGTLPKEWTQENIRQFQNYFDTLMQGNTQARRGMRFMPEGFSYTPAKDTPLKDMYDEWLARLICYVFSVPPTPFVAQVNRATAETAEQQARQEGLVPLQRWIKHFMDHIVQNLLGATEYEFAWADENKTDPLVQAQVAQIHVQNGLKSRDELRDELGEGPIPDGTGGDYTVSGAPLNPARLPTPEEQQQQHEQQLALIDAKKPAPGEGDEGAGPDAAKGEKDNADKALNPAGDLRKEAGFEEAKHPRDAQGRFASTGSSTPSSRAEPDRRPRDENGRFVYSGGGSRGPNLAATRRKRLIEGLKNAAERAVVGAALIGGGMLATAVFAPTVGTTGALAIAIARSLGTAAIGEASLSAVGSGLEFLQVPQSFRDTVQSGVALALGVYSVADAKTNLDAYLDANHPGARAPAGDAAAKMAKAKADNKDLTLDQVFDLVRAALYEVAQDAAGEMKAALARKARKGDGEKLAQANEGIEEALEDILDKIDKIGSPAPVHPDGGDRDSAKEHPVTDDVGKLAKKDDPWRFTEGGTPENRHLAKAGEGAPFAAGIMFWSSDDKVLYLKRTGDCPHSGTWCFPGGKIEPGETPAQAAVREANEEARVLAQIDLDPEMLGDAVAVNSLDDGRQFHAFVHRVNDTFSCALDEEESSGYVWAPFDDPPQPLHPNVSPIIEMARPMRSARKLAKGVNWKVLEPMWQPPAAEASSVRRFRKILSAALADAGSAVAKYVRAELAGVGKMAKAKKPKAQEIADKAPLDDITGAAGELADVSGDAARDVAFGALVRVGVGDEDGMVDRVSQRAVRQARDRAAELVGMRWDEASGSYVENPNPKYSIADNTREMIRDVIANGLEENLSAEDIADRIESSTAFSPERADLVAKTEIARVNSLAAVDAYKGAAAEGVRIKKKWIVAAKDVCDDCTKNAQQEPIDLDDEFQSGDKAPPQHPNCRCAIAPVVVQDEDGEYETVEED